MTTVAGLCTGFVIESVKPDKLAHPMAKGGNVVWYRANRLGYTACIGDAGVYTLEETRELLRDDTDGFLRAYPLEKVILSVVIKRKTLEASDARRVAVTRYSQQRIHDDGAGLGP